MLKSMLTTVDNPFDPFEQFDEWFVFDTAKGYNSCSLLAYYLDNTMSSCLPEKLLAQEQDAAIDQIIASDPIGIYKKVQKEIEPTFVKGSGFRLPVEG